MGAAISPRLARLFELLLVQEGPVSMENLAQALDSSRRTIFREIENADALLSQYNVELDSKPGRGIQLICPEEERERFLEALRSGPLRPGVRRQRLLCLLVQLLACDGVMQKLLYYAGELGVSESTVSNDLDLLEPYLAEYNLHLVRRPGAGVYVLGGEERIRAALTVRMVRDGVEGSYFRAYGYPPEEIENGVRGLISELEPYLGWMTGESLAFFTVFLMVTAERMSSGRFLKVSGAAPPSALQNLASLILGELERRFSLDIPQGALDAERRGVFVQLQMSRSREVDPQQTPESAVTDELKALVFRMIDSFDPALAPRLRLDEQLVDGLARHLAPAVIRIQKKIDLPAPPERIPAERYPGFFRKVGRAVDVLKSGIGVDAIPDGEVSFIAIYFYTALLCMDEQNIRKRTLRAGIVCVAGIGVSYMIASQLRKRYKGELEIEISGWNDQTAWERMDFLITTMPLDLPPRQESLPVIQVHALLEDEDYRKIREVINERAFVEHGAQERQERHSQRHSQRYSLIRRIEKAVPVLEQTWALLSGFAVVPCARDCGMDALCILAGERFGEGPGGPEKVHGDLLAREALSTQVVEELGLVLLHVRTAGAASPVFAVIAPEGGAFTAPGLKGAKSCVLMLLPQGGAPEMTGIMGRLSGALADTPVFLDAAQRGDVETLRAIAEAELADALVQYCSEKLRC
jgi:mannitol operon transcriptional antiterminator